MRETQTWRMPGSWDNALEIASCFLLRLGKTRPYLEGTFLNATEKPLAPFHLEIITYFFPNNWKFTKADASISAHFCLIICQFYVLPCPFQGSLAGALSLPCAACASASALHGWCGVPRHTIWEWRKRKPARSRKWDLFAARFIHRVERIIYIVEFESRTSCEVVLKQWIPLAPKCVALFCAQELASGTCFAVTPSPVKLPLKNSPR